MRSWLPRTVAADLATELAVSAAEQDGHAGLHDLGSAKPRNTEAAMARPVFAGLSGPTRACGTWIRGTLPLWRSAPEMPCVSMSRASSASMLARTCRACAEETDQPSRTT